MASVTVIADGVFIQVLDDRPPTDREWMAVLTLVRAKRAEFSCGLIWSEGGAPNSHQRKTMVEQFPEFAGYPRAVVSPSALVRGAATALSWFGIEMKAFSPEGMTEAFDFLRIPLWKRARLLATVAKMKTELATAA